MPRSLFVIAATGAGHREHTPSTAGDAPSPELPAEDPTMRDLPRTALGLATALALVVGASGARADTYTEALAFAAQLEREGHLDDAARVLESAVPIYRQDPALLLAIASIHLRAGRYGLSARFYRAALALTAGQHPEARLGLATTLAEEGRCEEALPLFTSLAEDRPDIAAARAGVARCTLAPAWRITPHLSLTGAVFPAHPVKGYAGGVTPGVSFAHASGFFFDATYRYTRFEPAASAGIAPWDQHEAYATLGFSRPLGGIALHYAFVYDGSGALGASHHVGFTARVSPYGDIELRGSASFYDDMTVLRAEPSWRIPIAGGFSIRPGGAVEWASGEVRGTGMLTLSLDRALGSLWAGGKYGVEIRPVYFSVPVVYDIPENIAYGAWAGAALNVNPDLRIYVSYAMDRLTWSTGADSAHTLTVGGSWSF
jgi:tetratricopeptide (TPR) repeat protein